MPKRSLLLTCVKCGKGGVRAGVVESYYLIRAQRYIRDAQVRGSMPARGYCVECFLRLAEARNLKGAEFEEAKRRLRPPAEQKPEKPLKRFHCDGAGCSPDGTGSGYGWVRLNSDHYEVQWVDGWTNNQAEYEGLLGVLRYLKPGSRALICTDSQLVVEQFNQRWSVSDRTLKRLLGDALLLIEKKQLEVEVRWIPRERNRAGQLLDEERGWD